MKCALHSEKLFISIALHNFFLPTFCSRTSACNFFCVWSTNPCALAAITEHANYYSRFAMLHRALILYKDKQFAKKVPQFHALTKKVLYCWNSCLTLWLFYPPPPPECVLRYLDKINCYTFKLQVQFPPFVLEKLYCYSGGRPERQALFTAIFQVLSGRKGTVRHTLEGEMGKTLILLYPDTSAHILYSILPSFTGTSTSIAVAFRTLS